MKTNKKIIFIFISILIVLFLGIVIYFNGNIVPTSTSSVARDNASAAGDSDVSIIDDNIGNDVDFNSNNKKNNDIIGKLKITNTNIDNDILQGSDNDYYLTRDSLGVKNIFGSTFMDYRNTFDDRKLLIYGHNSKTLKDAPFHDLEKYIDYTFYKNNKYITLTLNNEKVIYEIFSVMVIPKSTTRHTKITFNDKEWMEHLNWMIEESIYNTSVDVGLSDMILTLQTCYYEPENSYLIINARKVK